MKPENSFLHLPLEFWGNVRLISQYVGYTERSSGRIKIPTHSEIRAAYSQRSLGPDARLVSNERGTLGKHFLNISSTEPPHLLLMLNLISWMQHGLNLSLTD